MDDFAARQSRVVALTLMATGQRTVTICPADLAKLDNLFTYTATVDPATLAITVSLTERRAKGQKVLPLHSYGEDGTEVVTPVVVPEPRASKPKVQKGKKP